MKIINFTFRGILKMRLDWDILIGKLYLNLYKATYNIKTSGKITCIGKPIIRVTEGGKILIGSGLKMNSSKFANIIGPNHRCQIIVKGNLILGNNVGISSSTIVCHNSVIIEDNVKIGGNTIIYDTDFHSLIADERNCIPEIRDNIKTGPVKICEGAFIGGHSIILKGVTIGKHSIVGAGSVVTKNIPDNEVWGGNPAKLIKKLY